MNPALVFFESLLLLLEFTRNFVAVIKIHGLMSHTIQIRPKIIFKKNEEDEEAKKREGERKGLTLSNGKESSPSQVHIHTYAYGIVCCLKHKQIFWTNVRSRTQMPFSKNCSCTNCTTHILSHHIGVPSQTSLC